MKKMRKFMALAITAIMVIATGITGFAENEVQVLSTGPATLTVNLAGDKNIAGSAYAYRLMDLEVGEATKEYTYTVNDVFSDVLKSSLGLEDSSTNKDILNKIKSMESDSQEVKQFAEKLMKNIEEAERKNTQIFDSFKTEIKINNSKGNVDNLPYGYYFIMFKPTDTSLKSQRALVIVDGNKEVNLKVEELPFVKESDKETASIGDEVTYTIKTEIPDLTDIDTTNYHFVVRDTISKGLDFVLDKDDETNETVEYELKIGNTAVTNVTLPKATLKDNKKTMTLDLSTFIKEAAVQEKKGQELIITYKAIINSDAVIVENNKATLEYGNNGEIVTGPSEVETNVYTIKLLKVDEAKKMLAGAKFELYKGSVDENNKLKVSGSNGDYKIDPNSSETTLISIDSNINADEKYNLKIHGLAAGTYYLKEIEAPEGYNKLENPIKIEITKDGKGENWSIYKDGTIEGDKIIDIINKKGGLLPETGGMGTILFTVAGLALILMAIFGMKKRKEEN